MGDRGTKPVSRCQQAEAGQIPLQVSSRLSSRVSSGPLYLVFTGATPQRGSPAREAGWAHCGDMTTWSVAGGTSPRASLSM